MVRHLLVVVEVCALKTEKTSIIHRRGAKQVQTSSLLNKYATGYQSSCTLVNLCLQCWFWTNSSLQL